MNARVQRRCRCTLSIFAFRHIRRYANTILLALYISASWTILLAGCATTGDRAGATSLGTVLTTHPSGEQPTFLGVSPRMKNRDDEESIMFESAAVQAARFVHLRGEAAFLSRKTASGTGYIHSISIDDDFELASELSSSLDLVNSYMTDEGSFGRFILKDGPAIELSYRPVSRGADGAPGWISSVPTIDKYFVGVGASGRTRLVRDAIENSDREALFAILAQIGVEVTSDRFEKTTAGRGSVTGGESLERARGEIVGFYVVDRYIDSDGGAYTLAVCPREINIR